MRAEKSFWMVALLALAASSAAADDVKVRPAPGCGMVVTNAAGTSERLRVNESGEVSLPTLAPLAGDKNLCLDSTTGRIGTCAQPAVPDIIQLCASAALSCVKAGGCSISDFGNVSCSLPVPPSDCNSNEYRMTATCPAGYDRLPLTQCKKPNSATLVAHVYADPYDRSSPSCSYTGSINPSTLETLAISIYCIRQPADLCLKPQ